MLQFNPPEQKFPDDFPAEYEDDSDMEPEPDSVRPGVPKDDPFGNPFITVVHVNGVHHLPIIACPCEGPGKTVNECIFGGLFPASFEKIQTLFTFQCLEDYRLCNLEAKTSAYQFHNVLRRRTNPESPNKVPDRYASLRRLSRQWRILKKLKVHGFGNDQGTPGTSDMSLFCPTCPQEGINLPDDWEALAPKYVGSVFTVLILIVRIEKPILVCL